MNIIEAALDYCKVALDNQCRECQGNKDLINISKLLTSALSPAQPQRAAETHLWSKGSINEDELKVTKEQYDFLFPFSRVDGVRIFPRLLVDYVSALSSSQLERPVGLTMEEAKLALEIIMLFPYGDMGYCPDLITTISAQLEHKAEGEVK